MPIYIHPFISVNTLTESGQKCIWSPSCFRARGKRVHHTFTHTFTCSFTHTQDQTQVSGNVTQQCYHLLFHLCQFYINKKLQLLENILKYFKYLHWQMILSKKKKKKTLNLGRIQSKMLGVFAKDSNNSVQSESYNYWQKMLQVKLIQFLLTFC